jgi:hypothetical protein
MQHLFTNDTIYTHTQVHSVQQMHTPRNCNQLPHLARPIATLSHTNCNSMKNHFVQQMYRLSQLQMCDLH